MPNWCSNSFYIHGRDKTQVLKFYLDMVNATSTHPNFIPVDNSWNEKWVGNLFLGAGFDPNEVINSPNLQCRGCVTAITLVGDCEGVEIEDETAWGPNDESMQKLIDKYPGLKQVFIAEEPSCDVYINTDTEGIRYKTRYRFSYYKQKNPTQEEYGEEYFDSLEAAAEYISKFLDITVDAAKLAIQTDILDKYKDKFQKQFGDESEYYLSEFEH